jgi:hypothetical protein
VKTTRNLLFQLLTTDGQRACLPTTQGNTCNYYGTVTGGDSKKYDIRLYALPHIENIVHIARQKLKVVAEGEEQVDYDHQPEFDSEEAGVSSNKSPFTQSADEFCAMPTKEIADATVYEMRYGKAVSSGDTIETINWQILADNVHVEEDEDSQMNIPEAAEIMADIDLESKPLIETFFEHFFTDMIGHA